eukprot:FR742187.1.p1 GENE.FR742187.1~~FR742187.1.p1  ORF type:complete len:148 (-),score=23.02 FR742187.1:165-608(-)
MAFFRKTGVAPGLSKIEADVFFARVRAEVDQLAFFKETKAKFFKDTRGLTKVEADAFVARVKAEVDQLQAVVDQKLIRLQRPSIDAQLEELISSTRLLAEEVSAEKRVARVIDSYTLSRDDFQENRVPAGYTGELQKGAMNATKFEI